MFVTSARKLFSRYFRHQTRTRSCRVLVVATCGTSSSFVLSLVELTLGSVCSFPFLLTVHMFSCAQFNM